MPVAAQNTLERRLEALEEELRQLKARLDAKPSSTQPWWEAIAGTFANDPIYEEAMRLGRQWRESLRPHGPKKQKKARSPKS